MNGTSRRIAFVAAASVAAVLALPTGAHAQQTSLPDWKVGAIVYGWFPSTAGLAPRAEDEGDGGETARWRLTAGFASLGFDNVSATDGLSLGTPPGQLALPADAQTGVDRSARNWTYSLLGSYALVTRPHNRVELLGGARYLNLATSADGRLTGDVVALPRHALGESVREADAWDAVVGARGSYRFGDGNRWFLPYYLDIGAGRSDLTWQAMGGIGYAFSWGEVFASYRHLDYRFATESRIRSLSFSGPGVTFGARW